MKNAVVFTSLIFLMAVKVVFAQEESNYYPLHVGDFWVYHSDSYFPDNKPTTFRQEIEGIDRIGDKEYIRMMQRYTLDDGSQEVKMYIWMRNDSKGMAVGAVGESSSIESADIMDPPFINFSNEATTVGYTWDFEMEEQHFFLSIESFSRTAEGPAGTFTNCIVYESIIVNTSGDTTQVYQQYLAKDVGLVLYTGWVFWSEKQEPFKFELIEYSVQGVWVEDNSDGIPVTFNLLKNYPNPFNPSTVIDYEVPHESLVTLTILNILGREVDIVVQRLHEAGTYSVLWNATGLPSGIYFYRLQAEDITETKRMLLIR